MSYRTIQPKVGDTVTLVPHKDNPLYGKAGLVLAVDRRQGSWRYDVRIEYEGKDIGWFNWDEIEVRDV
jgi:hypothetical protein